MITTDFFPVPLQDKALQVRLETLHAQNNKKPLDLNVVAPVVESLKKNGISRSELADINALLARDGFFEGPAALALQQPTVNLAIRPANQPASAVTRRVMRSDDPGFTIKQLGPDTFKISGVAASGKPVWGPVAIGTAGTSSNPLTPDEFVKYVATTPIADAGQIWLNVERRYPDGSLRVRTISQGLAASIVSSDPALQIESGTSRGENRVGLRGTARQDGTVSAVIDGVPLVVAFKAGEAAYEIGLRLQDEAARSFPNSRLREYGWPAVDPVSSESGLIIERKSRR